MEITIIAAIQRKDNGLGKDNRLLFRIPEDMKRFVQLTTRVPNQPVIMGRKTYDSIPEKFKPLSGRQAIIITRNEDYPTPQNEIRAHSLEEALRVAQELSEVVSIAGGGEIYKEAIEKGLFDKLELTLVKSDKNADTFFPVWSHLGEIVNRLEAIDEKSGLEYAFITIEKWRK